MPFERVDVGRPEPAERRQPRIELLKRLRLQAVKTALCIHGGLHETGLPQYPKVLRDGRLRQTQLALDLADRLLRRDQEAQYRAAVRLGDDVENGFHGPNMLYSEYACQGIF